MSVKLYNRSFKKYSSLIIGLLGWFLGGIVFGFNAYAITLKQTFNYTQTEVDYIASSGDIGLSLQFIAGIVVDNFGSRISCIISFILTTIGFMLMWMATNFMTFFHSKYWLVCGFYFLASSGTVFITIPTMIVNCKNFDKKHSGKVLGFLNTMIGASPAILSALYEGFFIQGHVEDAENQKLGEFMMMLAIISACVTILAIIMLRTVPEKTDEYAEIKPSRHTDTVENNRVHNDGQIKGDVKPDAITERILEKTAKTTGSFKMDIKFWQMIQTPQFYYIFVICIIIGGLGGSFTNNITTVLRSSSTQTSSITFTVTVPIFATLGRFFGGAIPDYIFQRWPDIPRSSILLSSGILTCLSHIVFTLFNQSSNGLIFASIMAALAYGAFYVQVNLIVMEFFGIQYFGQNNGLMIGSHGIGIVLFQELFALNYEVFSPSGSRYCFGNMCTMWYFALASILSFCAVFLNVCLTKFERDWLISEAQK